MVASFETAGGRLGQSASLPPLAITRWGQPIACGWVLMQPDA